MKQSAAKLFHSLTGRFGDRVLGYRSILVIGTELLLIFAANLTAFALRFDADLPPEYRRIMWDFIPTVLLVYGIGLWVFGIQRGLWRYVDLHDLWRILLAALSSAAVFYGVIHQLGGVTQYPRSVIILTGLLTALYLAGIRLAVRGFREWIQIFDPSARRVLIVGAGHAGELLVRDMLYDANYHCCPVGFVDDDPIKRKMRIHGIPVVGAMTDIKKAAERLKVDEIIVAIPSGSTTVKQKILAASEGCS
ncbi:MAG: hypothetical protein JNN16_14480, partial [Nitrospira sp.]|nr:hypothetical protein [Nitrospira sp.]